MKKNTTTVAPWEAMGVCRVQADAITPLCKRELPKTAGSPFGGA